MKYTQIKLNNSTSIALEKLIESKLLIQANSGGGKSWALRRLLEQSHGKVQQIILDSEGEFGTLREKYDYVLAGKDGDTPADPRSAALLARRLLELNVSAIIDLFELHPQDRKRFVRIFLDSMINAPKDLWHDCIVVIDEAHTYAPEKGQSEAMDAVIGLAALGRKRGFCAVLATQRISKLHKDAAAECNNKLIGRASQDIDMKRAADELGFTSRDQMLSLRALKPGEFYAFGPAMSDEVQKITVGDVNTTHPKVGSRSLTKVVPPTAQIKKVLAKLADLPSEAKKEAQTVSELKAENVELKRQVSLLKRQPAGSDQKIVDAAVKDALIKKEREHKAAIADIQKQHENNVRFVNALVKDLQEIKGIASRVEKVKQPKIEIHEIPMRYSTTKERPIKKELLISNFHIPKKIISDEFGGAEENYDLGICAKKIYSFLYANHDRGFTKVQLGVVTGYSPTSGGFNNALSRLNSLELIRKDGDLVRIEKEDERLLVSGERFSPDPDFWAQKLGKCEREIYAVVWNHPENVFSKENLGEITNYSPTSGGFNNAISHLNAIGLIKRERDGIRLNPEILAL
jgi:hypothetical protein